jgi:hypothetical protein
VQYKRRQCASPRAIQTAIWEALSALWPYRRQTAELAGMNEEN